MVSTLLQSCEAGDLPQVQAILKDLTAVDLELKDEAGVTSLIHAVRNGHVEVVRALLDAGADPTNTSSEGSPEVFTSDATILDLLNSAREKKAQADSVPTSYFPPEGYSQEYVADPSKMYYGQPHGSYMYYPPMYPGAHPLLPDGSPAQFYSPPPPPPANMNGPPNSDANGGSLPPLEIARHIPCKYYPACRYGPNCIFFHPTGQYFNGPLPPPAQYPPYDPMSQQPYPSYYPMPPNAYAPPPPPPNGVINQMPTPPASHNSPAHAPVPGPELLSPMQAPYNPNPSAPPPLPFGMPLPAQYPPPGQAQLPPIPVGIAPLPPLQQPMMPPAPQPNGVMYQPTSPIMQPHGNAMAHHRRESSAAYPQAVTTSPLVTARDGMGNHVQGIPPPTDGFTQIPRGPVREGMGHARRGSIRRNSLMGSGRQKPPCSFFPLGKCRNGVECRFPHIIPDPNEHGHFPKFGPRKSRDGEPIEEKMQRMTLRTSTEGAADAPRPNGHIMGRPFEQNGFPRQHITYKASHPNALRPDKRMSGPPRPQQRIPNADDFPVLAGTITPPARSPGTVNGPTAAQVLSAPPPVRKDSATRISTQTSSKADTASSKADTASSDGGRSPMVEEKPPRMLNGNGHIVNGTHEVPPVNKAPSFASIATVTSPAPEGPAPVSVSA